MKGCPRQPPSRFQQHGRFSGVAGRFIGVASGNFGGLALKWGLPGGAKRVDPVLPDCFLQELNAFEVERDAQGPCCRQDGVPLARAGPRVAIDTHEPGPPLCTDMYVVQLKPSSRSCCKTLCIRPKRLRRSA